VATPRIPVHHAQELPIGGKLPSYFILKSLTQSFPLEWRDVLRYQRLRKLHADLHAANCAPLRDPFGADPARLLGRGLSRQQVMARAARHRESDAASRRAYVWADVATRFGGTSEGLARICRCSINVVLAELGLADALWTRHAGHVIVHLPSPSCGKTPLVARSFTSADDRELRRMTRFLASCPPWVHAD
jgi:hypothetical protein